MSQKTPPPAEPAGPAPWFFIQGYRPEVALSGREPSDAMRNAIKQMNEKTCTAEARWATDEEIAEAGALLFWGHVMDRIIAQRAEEARQEDQGCSL